MANFAVTITLVIASAIGAIYTTETNLRMLEVEAELAPALTLATGEKRPWVVNPMGIEKDFPAWGIACPDFSSNRSCAWKGLLPRREGDTTTPQNSNTPRPGMRSFRRSASQSWDTSTRLSAAGWTSSHFPFPFGFRRTRSASRNFQKLLSVLRHEKEPHQRHRQPPLQRPVAWLRVEVLD